MRYVHAPNGVFKATILPGQVYEFSDRCKTTAKRLTPEEAAEYGVSRIKLVAPPAFDSLTQSRREVDPVLVGSEWVQQWVVEALTPEEITNRNEIQAAQVRTERNAKLAATDWTQGRDIPDAVSATWAGYRQALRDVPSQAGFPWEVAWPAEP